MKNNDQMAALIAELEAIVGQHFYNTGKPDGSFSQYSRFPVYYKRNGIEYVSRDTISKLTADELSSVHYVTGANWLYIGKALWNVLEFLEKRYDLDFDTEEWWQNKKSDSYRDSLLEEVKYDLYDLLEYVSHFCDEVAAVIAELEAIVGQYYHNKQKRGGFYFRYPVWYGRNGISNEIKGLYYISGLTERELHSVHYRNGVNRLYIGDALAHVMYYLEVRYELDFSELEFEYLDKINPDEDEEDDSDEGSDDNDEYED